MTEVFRYLDTLVRVIKPQNLLFISVDGPAPLAKCVEQRKRRFKRAKVIQPGKFDANAISVGTQFMEDLNRCRAAADGSYYQHMDAYKTVQLLIVDDFMTTPIATQNAVDLFEIMEAREGRAATLIASQLEPNEWYLRIEGELMADSILNRVATGARYVDLDGPNMREYFAKQKGDR